MQAHIFLNSDFLSSSARTYGFAIVFPWYVMGEKVVQDARVLVDGDLK
jgi:hypothetical protein